MTPRFSIITPCLNRAAFIGQAVDSVREQRHGAVEHIVVDGGSTDGTLDVLRRCPDVQVISGPDRGMYDALNKGLAQARGEIVGFLNSDDCYAAGAFAAVERAFAAGPAPAVVGEAIFEDLAADGASTAAARFQPRSASLLVLATLLAPAFNAWFFRREICGQLGNFDARYRIAGDREFMLRFALAGYDYAIVDLPVYRYRRHAGSLTFSGSSDTFASVVAEHLMMSDAALARTDLSTEARKCIRQARTRETLDLAVRGLRTGRFNAFLRSAAAGTRRDPFWPVRLAGRALAALSR